VIAAATGIKSTWSSPSVYANADSLQGWPPASPTRSMGWILRSYRGARRRTGSLFYGPYPVSPSIWVESGADEVAARDRDTVPRSVLEFADEAHGDPAREATTVVIGIHAFVVGTPDGAAALRRVLARG
jgi:allantoinase